MNDLPAVIVPTIAVYNATTGELRDIAAAGNVPAGYSSCALPVGYDPAIWRWSVAARAMVEDPARVEAQLVAVVKKQAEFAKMAVITPGFGKATEYDQKGREAIDSAAIDADVLNTMPPAAATVRFPAASIEAVLSGERLADVLARYRARAAASTAEVYRLAAIEQVAVTRIEAATTAVAKRAAASAIDWTWSPA